jgi:hypothetical protein
MLTNLANLKLEEVPFIRFTTGAGALLEDGKNSGQVFPLFIVFKQ